jgi:hypothetical protein
MGRARNTSLSVAVSEVSGVSGFAAVLGTRRGPQPPSEEQVEAAATTLKRLSLLADYWPEAEARAVLAAGSISRGDAALRELCGLADEDFSDFARAALAAASAVTAPTAPAPGVAVVVSPVTHDPFAVVFGRDRGVGETRLDGDDVSASARTHMLYALDKAGSGDLDPACVLLSEHRHALSSPLVAELFAGVVAAACANEFAERGEWLGEFVHSTVRDGRDGRIVRVQTAMRSKDEFGEHILHLRPEADVDTLTHARSDFPEQLPAVACGWTESTQPQATAHGPLQRAPVGVWVDGTLEANYIYHHCPQCADVAHKVPETRSAQAGALPTSNLEFLASEHQGSVSAKLKAVLGRRDVRGADAASFARKSFPTAAIAAVAQYALGGGDARLALYCNSNSIVESRAREHGYQGPMVELLDTDFFVAALRARTARKSGQPRGMFSGPPKTKMESMISRRNRFSESVLNELDLRTWRIAEGEFQPETAPTSAPRRRRAR